MSKHEFNPDYCVPPGETLKETMRDRGIGMMKLQGECDLSYRQALRLFVGQHPIGADLAAKLEALTLMPAAFWLEREKQYRGFLARKEADMPTKHTPGPWEASCEEVVQENNTPLYTIRAASGDIITSELENYHDARLIASAPELLKVCKRSYDSLVGRKKHSSNLARDMLTAIAKAEKTE